MLLLRHLHFFDEAFQQREGTLCFVFSRLRVVDEESERGKRRMHYLSFEDFLEAVVRLATVKALPTTAELAAAAAAASAARGAEPLGKVQTFADLMAIEAADGAPASPAAASAPTSAATISVPAT